MSENNGLVYMTEQGGDDFKAHLYEKLDEKIHPIAFVYVDDRGNFNIDTTVAGDVAQPFTQALYDAAVKHLMQKQN